MPLKTNPSIEVNALFLNERVSRLFKPLNVVLFMFFIEFESRLKPISAVKPVNEVASI